MRECERICKMSTPIIFKLRNDYFVCVCVIYLFYSYDWLSYIQFALT